MSQMASASPGGIGPSLPGDNYIIMSYRSSNSCFMTNFEVSEFLLSLSDFLVSWVISSEDRTKHEATFQSLNPSSGFLTG